MRNLSCCLIALLLCLFPAIVSAQTHNDWTQYADDETHPASLLGSHYSDIQYVWFSGGRNGDLTGDIDGALTSFNVPARWNRHLPEYIGQDVFINTSWLNGGYSIPGGQMAPDPSIGPPVGFNIDYEARSFSTGLSTWVYLNEDVRPFLQLGLGTSFGALGVSYTGLQIPGITLGSLDNRLVANPGVEVVVHEDIFWRSQLNIETRDQFRDSIWRTEIVAWLGEHLFLRGGVLGDLRGDGFGGTFGAGLAW